MGVISTGVVPRAALFVDNNGTGALPAVPFPSTTNGGFPLQINELMLLTVFVNSGAAGTVTTPSGWTVLNSAHPVSGSSYTFWSFWKLATAADVIAGSLTVTTSYTNGPICASLNTYANVKTSAPISAFSINAGTDNVNKYILAGQTTPATPSAMAVVFSSNSNSATVAGEGFPNQYNPFCFSFNDTYNMVGAHGPLTPDTSPINPAIVWNGQYSQFQICTLVILIAPADFVPVPVLNADRLAVAAAFGATPVEASVASPAFVSISVIQALQAIAAVTYGVNANAATSSPVYYDASGTRQRLAGNLDGNLNRTGTTLTFS